MVVDADPPAQVEEADPPSHEEERDERRGGLDARVILPSLALLLPMSAVLALLVIPAPVVSPTLMTCATITLMPPCIPPCVLPLWSIAVLPACAVIILRGFRVRGRKPHAQCREYQHPCKQCAFHV